ncbi:MAG: hypothetical protein ACFHHU_00225 [Porticoccaceae bacterium]
MHRLLSTVISFAAVLFGLAQFAHAADYNLNVEIKDDDLTIWSLHSPVKSRSAVLLQEAVDGDVLREIFSDNPGHEPVDSAVTVRGFLLDIVPDGVTHGKLSFSLDRADGLTTLSSGNASLKMPNTSNVLFESTVNLRMGLAQHVQFINQPNHVPYDIYVTLTERSVTPPSQ